MHVHCIPSFFKKNYNDSSLTDEETHSRSLKIQIRTWHGNCERLELLILIVNECGITNIRWLVVNNFFYKHKCFLFAILKKFNLLHIQEH